MKLVDKLINLGLIKPTGKLHVKIKSKLESNPALLQEILNETSFLLPDADLKERIYCIRNGITSHPTCKVCGLLVKFRDSGKFRNTYATLCSSKCVARDEDVKEKRKKTKDSFCEETKKAIKEKRECTNLDRFGCKNPLGNSEIIKKRKQTNLERYGFENPSCNAGVREKRKQTNLERYGYENALSNAEVREKCKQTNLKRYGVSNVWFSDEIQAKRFETMNKLYGADYALQSEDFQQKFKKTMIEKYNVQHALQSQDIYNKFKDTMVDKYKVDHPLKDENLKQNSTANRNNTIEQKYGNESYPRSLISNESLKRLNDGDWMRDQHLIQQKTLTKIAEELEVAHSTVGLYMKKHQIKVVQLGISQAERDLADYIRSHGVKIIQNNRDLIPPYEIDIYLPEYDIAFEYNGIFWHSELNGKGKNYHLNKMAMCVNNNIRLIHIFENEWLHKQEIVKSRIKNLIKKSNRIYARKCTVNKLSSVDASLFLKENHIQGSCSSSINYGLFLDNTLVACMTFGKSRFNKRYEYELLRYANIIEHSVTGGASKLFHHFIKNHAPLSVISYSDNRWNTGNLYQQLGFKYLHSSKPNYFYFKSNNTLDLLSRQNFQKHKLHKRLEHFNPKLTEWENMQNNDYDRIWDCGNTVWVWEYKN